MCFRYTREQSVKPVELAGTTRKFGNLAGLLVKQDRCKSLLTLDSGSRSTPSQKLMIDKVESYRIYANAAELRGGKASKR